MAKKKARKPPEPNQRKLELTEPVDVDDKREYLECELAILRGETPTVRQQAARRRWMKAEAERVTDRVLRSMAYRDFCRILGAGLHTSTLTDLSKHLGLDGIGLDEIDVVAWLRSLFPLLRENWATLSDDEHAQAEAAMRTAKLKLEAEKMAYQVEEYRLKRDDLAGDRITRDEVRAVLGKLAALIKKAGERFGRRQSLKGSDVQRQFNAILDSIEREFGQ